MSLSIEIKREYRFIRTLYIVGKTNIGRKIEYRFIRKITCTK